MPSLPAIGGALSTGLDFVSGISDLFGGDDNDFANWSNQQNNIAAANEAADRQNTWHNENLNFQRQVLSNSVAWRVADAERAGVHPMYALGMQGVTGSPTGAFATPANVSPYEKNPDNWESRGQGLRRAASAMMSPSEKSKAARDEANATKMQQYRDMLDLQRAGLENDLLRARLSNEVSAGTSKGMPESTARPLATMPVPARRDAPGVTMDEPAAGQISRDPAGGYSLLPSPAVSEALENSGIWNQAGWALKNQILPSFGVGKVPMPQDGKKYNYWFGNYVEKSDRSKDNRYGKKLMRNTRERRN